MRSFLADQKERRFRPELVQEFQDLRGCLWVGAIVNGQPYFSLRRAKPGKDWAKALQRGDYGREGKGKVGKEKDPEAFETSAKQDRERDEGRCDDIPKRNSRAERHRVLKKGRSLRREEKKAVKQVTGATFLIDVVPPGSLVA